MQEAIPEFTVSEISFAVKRSGYSTDQVVNDRDRANSA